ncbi:hypothetical protein NQZ79_g4018 [Umbelopsis isabellina]|nr:hypothetical protein NQZ79_g4018 [Umbelopsis isabellina]
MFLVELFTYLLDAHRSFWKRQGNVVPGSSVHVVKAGSTPGGVPSKVVGAQYSYATLITSKSSKKEAQALATVPSYIGQPGTVSGGSKSSPAIGSSKPYAGRSAPLPPVKNFNAFMKQTNDEWDDALDDVNSTDMPELGLQPEVPQIQKRVHSKTSRPDTPASPAPIETKPSPEIVSKEQQPASLRKRNSNGLKDNIPGLLTVAIMAKAFRPVLDPSNLLQSCIQDLNKVDSKYTRFKNILSCSNVDLAALRELSWSGIPPDFRPMAWQILLGYLPCNSDRRVATLARKRKEYEDGMSAAYARGTAGLDQTLWHQIHIDIPRTNPGIPLYQSEATQMVAYSLLSIMINAAYTNTMQCHTSVWNASSIYGLSDIRQVVMYRASMTL